MNLLLDPCTLIWLASEPGRLSANAAATIDDPTSALHVSHASLWEITLNHGAGKLSLPDPPRVWWSEKVRQWGLIELPLMRRLCSSAASCLRITKTRLTGSFSPKRRLPGCGSSRRLRLSRRMAFR